MARQAKPGGGGLAWLNKKMRLFVDEEKEWTGREYSWN